MDKTTNAESKPDYASVLSRYSQAPIVQIGTEDLLTANSDEVRVPNILCQQVDLSKKSSQSSTIPTNSKNSLLNRKVVMLRCVVCAIRSMLNALTS